MGGAVRIGTCIVVVAGMWLGGALSQAGEPAVKLGIDVWIERGFAPLAGKKIGLITNPTGVTRDLRPTIDVLHETDQLELVRLFGPEHGVRGAVPAGEHIADANDPATGLPVYSLYGKTRKPTPEMLAGLDALVFDIQDIGSRSYTYISTMTVVMEAAAEQGLPFVVLDRPNPLGGERIEGRPLDPNYKSFVGYLPVPYCHGMTVGELARMINEEGWLANGVRCELIVVPMEGWQRGMSFADSGLTWLPTSPHIPRADSAMFYAATGIMGELHVMNEGVGYPLPFELIGRPGLDAMRFADELNGRHLAGVHFQPTYYRPYYGTFEKETCAGVQVILTDPRQAVLTEIQFHALDAAHQQLPDEKWFGQKRDATFDKVCGTDLVRKSMEAGEPLDKTLQIWREGVDTFRTQRAKYLLY